MPENTGKNIEPLPSSQIQRLFFIETRLRFAGGINRRDLVEAFGIKEAAATRDLAFYREVAPENIVYDSKSKTYLVADTFKSRFEPSFTSQLRVRSGLSKQPTAAESLPCVDSVILPSVNLPNETTLEIVTRAISTRTYVLTTYHSLSSVTENRKIAPFAVLNNGFRWYARCFDIKRNQFRDFIINRMTNPVSTKDKVEESHTEIADDQWNRMVVLKVAAHNALENLQEKSAIEVEYGMKYVPKKDSDGNVLGPKQGTKVLDIRVRAALVGYFLRNWNIDCSEGHTLRGKEYQLRLMNVAALYGIDNLNLAPGYQHPEY